MILVSSLKSTMSAACIAALNVIDEFLGLHTPQTKVARQIARNAAIDGSEEAFAFLMGRTSKKYDEIKVLEEQKGRLSELSAMIAGNEKQATSIKNRINGIERRIETLKRDAERLDSEAQEDLKILVRNGAAEKNNLVAAYIGFTPFKTPEIAEGKPLAMAASATANYAASLVRFVTRSKIIARVITVILGAYHEYIGHGGIFQKGSVTFGKEGGVVTKEITRPYSAPLIVAVTGAVVILPFALFAPLTPLAFAAYFIGGYFMTSSAIDFAAGDNFTRAREIKEATETMSFATADSNGVLKGFDEMLRIAEDDNRPLEVRVFAYRTLADNGHVTDIRKAFDEQKKAIMMKKANLEKALADLERDDKAVQVKRSSIEEDINTNLAKVAECDKQIAEIDKAKSDIENLSGDWQKKVADLGELRAKELSTAIAGKEQKRNVLANEAKALKDYRVFVAAGFLRRHAKKET